MRSSQASRVSRMDKYAPGELENKDKIDIHMDNKLEVILHLQKFAPGVHAAILSSISFTLSFLALFSAPH